jgi:hypothetical protein
MDIKENMNDFDTNLSRKIYKTCSSDDPICGRLVPLPDGEILLVIIYIYLYMH